MATEDDGFAAVEQHDAVWKRDFRRRLLAWYRQHARDLPWRRTRDPYQVWVSEIMLQQTQVATVVDYFERFLTAFPTIEALAAADEQRVLRQWEGLGYYRRARQMHKAARVIRDQHDGRFPREPDAVRALPGIGRYTAGAILSIAFDAREPIVEANTQRVLSRLLAFRGDPLRAGGQKRLWAFAEEILPRKNTGDFNQAMMELGGICTPREPRCLLCPVARLCPAKRLGLQEAIPAMRKPMQYEEVQETAVVVHRHGKVLLRQCPPDERWAGLWDFLRFETDRRADPSDDRALSRGVEDLAGILVGQFRKLTTLRHGVTRFRITLRCLEASYVTGRLRRSGPPLKWAAVDELPNYPLSVTGRQIARLLFTRDEAASHPKQ